MHQHPFDKIISLLDIGLRYTHVKPDSERASPGDTQDSDAIQHNEKLKQASAAMMRVNHVGEVCAQALYQGQSLTSRSEEVRDKMQLAANEEIDHLNWCHQRVEQLDSHVSHLNPLWYMGSLAIGVGAGLVGDKWSLGFLAETERQVVEHLESHLQKLPEEDSISRAIVEQMREDEDKHAHMAIEQGAEELPESIKKLMQGTAKIMTSIASVV